jgi:hypothetical protein
MLPFFDEVTSAVSTIIKMTTYFGQFGTNDFIEYWTAFRLFISQQNPYDPQLMLPLQQQQGSSATMPLMMWNPPWLLVLMGPILMLDFPQAATAWLVGNLLLLGAIIFLCLDILSCVSEVSRSQKYLSIPIVLIFFPLYNSLAMGQLGVLLAFGFVGTIWSIVRKKRLIGGCFLALWTIKVHLFIPIAVFLLCKSFRDCELWYHFLSGVLVVTILICCSEFINPSVTHSWLTAFSPSEINPSVTPVNLWKAATLTGGLRILLSKNNIAPVWPMWVVPLIGILTVITVTLCVENKNHPQQAKKSQHISYLEGSIFAALISLIFGPFGWLFDFTVLLPGYLITTLLPLGNTDGYENARWCSRAAIVLQGLMWALSPVIHSHEYWLWFPPIMLFVSIPVLWRLLIEAKRI